MTSKVKLGEVVAITTGKLDANAAVENGRYPFFTTAREVSRIADYAYDLEAVLVAGNGDLNVKYYKGKFNAYQRTYILTAKSDLNMRYLFYFLDKYVEVLRQQAIGGVIKYIKLTNLIEAPLPLRNLLEQDRIVHKLSYLDSQIKKRKQQLTELDKLVKSRFNEMFGEYSETGTLGNYILELQSGKSLAGDKVNKNKVLKTGAVSYDYFNKGEIKNLPISYVPSSKHKVQKGDIIISRMNTSELVGAAGYVWEELDNIFVPDRLWRAILFETVNPIFLWQLIIQDSTKIKIQKLASGTSGSMKNISKKNFLDINTILPPLPLQEEFVRFVEAVDKSKLAVKQSLDELETLKKKLMQDYFG